MLSVHPNFPKMAKQPNSQYLPIRPFLLVGRAAKGDVEVEENCPENARVTVHDL